MNNISKIISVAASAMIFLNCGAAAASAEKSTITGTWGENISWSLDGGKLTLSGTGEMTDIENFTNVYHNKFNNADNYADYPWGEYYDVITDVVIEDGITSVADGAFCYYPELKNVSIPDSVLSLGNESFSCCKNLREITIPSNTDIMNYTEFEIPAFNYYTNSWGQNDSEMKEFYDEELANMTSYEITVNGYDYSSSYYYCIENTYCSFNSIGTSSEPYITPNGSAGSDITWTFSDLGTITFSGNGSIDVDNFDENINNIAPFVRKVVFDEGITGIGQMAFVDFDYIENVEFSDTVTEIGNGAFAASLNTLGSVIIPNSVETIGKAAYPIKKDNSKIYGYSDSAAEKYAAGSDNIQFVAIDKMQTCDVDCDGVIELNDATEILTYYAQTAAGINVKFDSNDQINNMLIEIADANGDGIIDLSDATLTLEQYARNAAGLK